VDETALALLRSYNWPGNIRELHNVLEAPRFLARGRLIRLEDLPDLNVSPDAGAGPAERRTQAACRVVREVADRGGAAQLGRKSVEAARQLHVNRATLSYKMKAYGLQNSSEMLSLQLVSSAPMSTDPDISRQPTSRRRHIGASESVRTLLGPVLA